MACHFNPFNCIILASSKYFVLILFSLISSINTQQQQQPQNLVSPELRKLAISTNQFGLDALKILDKSEPANKVIVFCPLCLSSTLAMIMMGSSKNQVVNSLRQALYVWSMKPQEINKGFKDLFEYIGLNQALPVEYNKNRMSTYRKFNSYSDLASDNDAFESTDYLSNKHLSLPNLIKWKESVDMYQDHKPSKLNRLDQNTTQSRKYANQTTTTTPSKDDDLVSSRFEITPSSHMNAISNIYFQRGLTINYKYKLLLRNFYKTVVHPVDFIRRTEETRQHINSLVSSNSEGKIRELIKSNPYQLATSKLMIVTAFHFRGTLDLHMINKQSQKRIKRKDANLLNHNVTIGINSQTKNSNNTIESSVKTSNQQRFTAATTRPFIKSLPTILKYGKFTDLDCSVVEIPFNNRLVSLIIIMPNEFNSTELLLTKLNARGLSDLISLLRVNKMSLEIPLIKFDRGPLNVARLLSGLGLNRLFFGDKFDSYSTETGLNKWLRPGDIIHETSIDIGTYNVKQQSQTANVVEDRLTSVAHISDRSRQHLDNNNKTIGIINHIRFDKPFFYFVMDSINGFVLTMGRVRE